MAARVRQKSVHSVECVCGRHIETELDKFQCPSCKRDVVIEWPVEEAPEIPESQALPASEPA